MRKAGMNDPPTAEQLDRMYRGIEADLLTAISDFGVDELNQMIAATKAIRARRPS
jgi:hypothetical protein